VPDDIITVGAAGRRSRRDADASIESLYHTHYPHIVYTAFGLVGDWDLAEQLAQEAYLRLWRRWRLLADPQAAPAYLQRTVVNLSRETIRRRIIERRALKARSMERPPAAGPDTAAHLEQIAPFPRCPRGNGSALSCATCSGSPRPRRPARQRAGRHSKSAEPADGCGRLAAAAGERACLVRGGF